MTGKFDNPVPAYAPRAAIERLAEQAAGKLGYRAGGDIFETAENLGGRIRPGARDNAEKQSGTMVARTLSDWTIYLSPIETAARDRFAIAHDIGHLILHLPLCKQRRPHGLMRAPRYNPKGSAAHKRAEWEANWFALAFLMPAADFKTLFEEAGKATCGLRFGVSGLAVRARAQGLRLGLFL